MITSPTNAGRALLGLIVLCSVPLVRAADTAATPSLEERLTRLEAAIQRIEKRLDDTVTADELAPTLKEYRDLTKALAWDGKSPLTAVKPAGKEKALSVGGFTQANFESGNAPDSRFAGINNRVLLRRARINVAGTYAEDVSFKVEADFGANSLSGKAGLAGQFTDAYVSWTKLPEASLRLGQFKTPFGYEQLTPDTKLYTTERSIANDKITVGRQVGAMVFGDLVNKRFNYSFGAFNGTGVNTSINDNQKFMWSGRAAAVVFDGEAGTNKVKLTTGVDYFDTHDKANTTLATTFNGHRSGSGVDAQLVYGPAEVQAEWLRSDLHPLTGIASASQGWELLGVYSVTKKWQGLVRYETYDSNIATGNTTTDVWTFGVNYLLKGDDLKLSLDYLSGDQPVPAPHGDRLIGRVQIVF